MIATWIYILQVHKPKQGNTEFIAYNISIKEVVYNCNLVNIQVNMSTECWTGAFQFKTPRKVKMTLQDIHMYKRIMHVFADT